ncbi:hypothetical protein VS_2134 [Vibrio atlanticus]|uniref:Uncharacterized protein n=1 Tax=Vibrio atlanticus (strain LGP32) TaxID=575788 RepID=B7VHT9_VIBA3|nr:hypothetical protein VS_2134 [Vibrio atlanticus]
MNSIILVIIRKKRLFKQEVKDHEKHRIPHHRPIGGAKWCGTFSAALL